MAIKRETYGLPDETLQLIGDAPELDFGMQQQTGAAQFATPGVRRSDLISALRGIPGAANTGFTRYANAANGAALTPNSRKYAGANSPSRLGMQGYVAPAVTLPGGETQTPVVRPDPVVLPPDIIFDPPVIDPDPVDPDPVEPDPVTPDPVLPDPVVPDPVEPDPVDPDPYYIDPTELDPFELDPLVYPEVPERERIGTVEITPVDPNEETPQDDGTTDDILDLINYLNSVTPGTGTTGGGKSVFDETLGSLEF